MKRSCGRWVCACREKKALAREPLPSPTRSAKPPGVRWRESLRGGAPAERGKSP